MTYKDRSIELLKTEGYRMTAARILILEILEEAGKPLKAYDIAALSHGALDVTTVYRFLEVLKKFELVHFVKELQAYTTCASLSCEDRGHCHHQFVCKKCEAVEELHFENCDFVKALAKQFANLRIEDHYLELSGFCKNCKS